MMRWKGHDWHGSSAKKLQPNFSGPMVRCRTIKTKNDFKKIIKIFAEIHAAAKETVALAENQFMTNSHNWPFDNAWQEMLNHATQKVIILLSPSGH